MRRRNFIQVLAGVASFVAGSSTVAQRSGRRLAICSPFEPTALMNERSDNRYYRALFAELRRLGYVEGQTLVVQRYGREDNVSGPAEMVEKVIRSNPDVIYAIPPTPPLFKRLTDKIPLVGLTGDPVAMGLVQSLARPGGNMTGVSVDTGPSIHGKRIALLREIVPGMSTISCLTLKSHWDNLLGAPVRAACDAAGIALVTSLVGAPGNGATYREAVAQAARDGAHAILVGDNPDTLENRALIASSIQTAGLPAMYGVAEFVDAGGLIAYSYDLVELNKRAAGNIAAILGGANPGEIPYYQASKFDLSINLRSARVLGLSIPASLLASADHVIE
jgi:putative tryptophan/tyrosine transport system substrate-binding protein